MSVASFIFVRCQASQKHHLPVRRLRKNRCKYTYKLVLSNRTFFVNRLPGYFSDRIPGYSDNLLWKWKISSHTREAVQFYNGPSNILVFGPLRWRNRGDWTKSFIDFCFSGVPSISCSCFNCKWLSMLLVPPVYVLLLLPIQCRPRYRVL